MKIAIVTDSTSSLSQDILKQYHIHVVPLSVNFGTLSYKEGIDITIEEFYKKLAENDALPTTSQPAIGDFVHLYQELANNYEGVVSIHLSSGISGTMNTSIIASNMVNDLRVEVIDSEIACYGLGFMAIEAAEMAKEGKNILDIKERLELLVKNMRGYFVVDDLAHLHRGGRLNATQFLVGNLLNIKPIIYFNDKKLEPYEKIRTKKKAIDRILQLLDKDAKNGSKIKCSIVQANVLKEAEELKERIEKKYPNIEVGISEFGPVIGTHTGPGSIGFVWYKTEKK